VGIPITAWLAVTATATQAAEDECRALAEYYGGSCRDAASDWWGGTAVAGITSGAFVIAGIVNMGMGSKARKVASQTRLFHQLSFTPAHSRRFTGVSLSGRF
jgi:hypothetical protein